MFDLLCQIYLNDSRLAVVRPLPQGMHAVGQTGVAATAIVPIPPLQARLTVVFFAVSIACDAAGRKRSWIEFKESSYIPAARRSRLIETTSIVSPIQQANVVSRFLDGTCFAKPLRPTDQYLDIV
jgi:hypothetical protein